jgi:hypothetical protein
VNTDRLLVAIALAPVGIVYGLFMGGIGIFLAGAGHGWCSGYWAWFAAFLLPLFGVALAYRDQFVGRITLSVLITGMIGLNSLLVCLSWNEGWHYLYKVLSDPAGLMIWLFWLTLWLGWQVAVLAIPVFGRKREAPSASANRPRD